MEGFLQSEDYTLWNIVTDGPLIPSKLNNEDEEVPKVKNEFNDLDYRMLSKNAKAMSILMCGLGPDEYNRVSSCTTAKEVWDTLRNAHEGTTQVRKFRRALLSSEYENFTMKDGESLNDMVSRFTTVVNELVSLGKTITTEEKLDKLLRTLPSSWDMKVTAIRESKDLEQMTLDELVGNLKTFETKAEGRRKGESSKEKNIAFKATNDKYSDSEDEEVALLTRNFKKFIMKTRGAGMSTRSNNKVGACYKCDQTDHLIKDCPLWEAEWKKEQIEREIKRKRLGSDKKKDAVAMYAGWAPELEDSDEEEQANIALMAMEEPEEEDISADEVSPLELKDRLDSLSKRKLTSLFAKLIDSYNSLNEGKEQLLSALTTLKFEHIDLEGEKQKLVKENSSLKSQVSQLDSLTCSLKTELLAATKGNPDKQPMSSNQLKCEDELRKAKECLRLERDRLIEVNAELVKTNKELEHAKKWMSSQAIVTHLSSQTENCKTGLGYERTSAKDGSLCTSCGKTGHTRNNCPILQISQEKNRRYSLRNKGPHKHCSKPAKGQFRKPKGGHYSRRPVHKSLEPYQSMRQGGKTRHMQQNRAVTQSCSSAPKKSNNQLPAWARRSLIHPFDTRKGPKLIWVLKSQL